MPFHAILELSKGKFTSDPAKHTGEGIFFTSRMFDRFIIYSRGLCFFGHEGSDYLAEERSEEFNEEGTWVIMRISKKSTKNALDVFDQFSDPDLDPSFNKTIIRVKLMQFEGQSLMSRSQAKRLLARVDHFKEAVLDFEDVVIIGQAFADEIFRVFQNEHPEIILIPVNAHPDVERMIRHVKKEV
ncbi:MAG: STAS-like domain-containing protein [Eubacteriales bacterium]